MTMTTTTADHPKNHQTMLDYGQIAFLQVLARFSKESSLQKWAGLRAASPKYWLDLRKFFGARPNMLRPSHKYWLDPGGWAK